MKKPTMFEWYQVLRRHYQFTVVQAVQGARTSPDSKRLREIGEARRILTRWLPFEFVFALSTTVDN